MTYLQELMDSAGLSQRVLSRWTGINKGKLSLILNKKAPPNKKEARILEDFFKGLPINILLEDVYVSRQTEVS